MSILTGFVDGLVSHYNPDYARRKAMDEQLAKEKELADYRLRLSAPNIDPETMKGLFGIPGKLSDATIKDHPHYEAATQTIPTDHPEASKKGAEKWDAMIRIAADHYGVAPELIKAVIQTESEGNPNAQSPTGPQGLMQLSKAAAIDAGIDPAKRFDPQTNIMGGTAYLKQMMDKVGPDKAYLAYHEGLGGYKHPSNAALAANRQVQQLAQLGAKISPNSPNNLPALSDIYQADSGQVATDAPQQPQGGLYGMAGNNPTLVAAAQTIQRMMQSGDPALQHAALQMIQTFQTAAIQDARGTGTMQEANAAGLPIMDYQRQKALAGMTPTPQMQNAQVLQAGSPDEKSAMRSVLGNNPADAYAAALQKELGTQAITANMTRLNELPQSFAMGRNLLENYDSMEEAIKTARDLVRGSFWSSGTFSDWAKKIGGTDAADLASRIKELKSNTTLQTLQNFKAQSASGAAGFGGTTEGELGLIGSQFGDLEQSTSKEEFLKKLDKLERHVGKLRANTTDDIKGIATFAKGMGQRFPDLYAPYQYQTEQALKLGESPAPSVQQRFNDNRTSYAKPQQEAEKLNALRQKYGVH